MTDIQTIVDFEIFMFSSLLLVTAIIGYIHLLPREIETVKYDFQNINYYEIIEFCYPINPRTCTKVQYNKLLVAYKKNRS
jgi:hypothetical protein